MSILAATGTLCLALLTSSTTTLAPTKVDLAYSFRTDEPVRYTMKSSSVMTQIIGDQVMKMSEETVTQMTRQRVATKEDGKLVIRQTAESFSFRESTPVGEFSFDSEREADASKRADERVEAIYKTLGWETDYVITPEGEVLGVDNLEQLEERIDGIDGAELKEILQEAFSEEILVREVGPFMHLLTDGPVEEGDTWVRTFTVDPGPMTMVADQNMVVDSIVEGEEGSEVRVSFEGDLDITLPEDFPPFMKLTASTIKGTFVFNTHYGTVSSYHGTMHFGIAGSPGEGMPDVTMNMDINMAYEMKRD